MKRREIWKNAIRYNMNMDSPLQVAGIGEGVVEGGALCRVLA